MEVYFKANCHKISYDGNLVIAVPLRGREINIFSFKKWTKTINHKVIQTIKIQSEIAQIALSEDNSTIACSTEDGKIIIWRFFEEEKKYIFQFSIV